MKKKIAQKVLNEVNNKLDGKVVTKISKEKNYVKAENYHQKYFQKKNSQ
jgi:peptide methionine sulfoxide reductase MsrA